MNKPTIVYHSADYDGQFCAAIANKFVPDSNLVGWDFGDKPIPLPKDDSPIYVLDLPIDRPFGLETAHKGGIGLGGGNYLNTDRFVWIDHHKSSIDTHPEDIAGWQVEGVSACRLAWQWFTVTEHNLQHRNDEQFQIQFPTKQDFLDRKANEPRAVRLAGEYDVFSPRMKDDPEIELFQHGLNGTALTPLHWAAILATDTTASLMVDNIIQNGISVKVARDKEYAMVIAEQGFDLRWEGIDFLACNSHELDIRSQLFEAGIKPFHDALLGFTFNGISGKFRVSMYQIPGKEHVDVLSVAKKYGGGGHPGACGCLLTKTEAQLLFPQ